MSRKRVVRLMQAEGLKGRMRKRFKQTTMSDHDQPVAANVLAQEFGADAPNQRWVADTTEFVIGSSGKLYLAAMLDLYSRFLVGWAVSAINDRHLVIKALQMALQRRRPAEGLLHHSDQGSPGEFHWSSQHLDDEVLRCRNGDGEGQTGRGGRRCVRLVGRRSRGVRSSAGSRRRSPGGCRVRMPLCHVGCRRPWVGVGSVWAVGCRRSAWRPDQLATCLLRSGKKSRS